MTSLPLAFIGNLGGPDLLIIGIVALLIFGKRLPDVGKNLGRTIVEFKKGLNSSQAEEVAPEEPEAPVAKRPPARIAASSTTARPSKSLPQTEEV